MLELKNISKSFGDKKVLTDISLTLTSGKVYGLIGKNGAGKTTLMNIIAKVYNCDSGEILIEGHTVTTQNDLARKVGYILDIPSTFDYLTAHEYLEFILCPIGLDKQESTKTIKNILAKVNLSDTGNKQIKTFSRGMKQRLGIASGLVFDPKIIIMDEPSSALDPEGRREVLQIIDNLKKDSKTILLSTHILNDVERVCDQVGLLSDGVIVVEGKTTDIINKYSGTTVVVETSKENFDQIKSIKEKNDFVKEIIDAGSAIEIVYEQGYKQKVFEAVAKLKIDIDSIHVKKASIEDVFIAVNSKGEK